MKKLLWLFAFAFICTKLFAQPLNNEWIDYSKTYYKFKVGATGLYRINQPTLASAGLTNIAANEFQLWRNGVQVPLFTSIATGQLGANDYIEFWGEMNDGKLDKLLYKDPANQLSDKLSLQTDTAAYFLTVNTNIANNLRYANAANNVAANTLAAEPFFTHTLRYNFKERSNRGYAVNVGEDIYSSTYDVCEFLSTQDISLNSGAYKIPLNNLFTYPTGATATLSTGIGGSANKSRSIKVGINNATYINKLFSGYSASINTNNAIPLSIFNGNADTATINIVTSDPYDRVIASFFEITYSRQFNFGGNSNFEFQLPASSKGYFLQIANFNAGSAAPVLYNTTTSSYYIGDISIAGKVQFALPATNTTNSYVLVSRDVNNINAVSNLQSKRFANYLTTVNQGNYIIISNKKIMTGINAVEQYSQYRSSVAGGSYNAKIFDIDELVDQFAFGIKKHPLSIRNFILFADANFAQKPKFVFFIGKGVTYNEYRFLENNADIENQNLVPTFGWPASDAMLTSPNNNTPAPILPFGRLSAITQQEVVDYLDKVKIFELQAANTTQTIANKAWMKQLIHVAGGKSDSENDAFEATLARYENTIKDTSFGGVVRNFNKKTGSETSQTTQADMQNAFANGLAIVTYLGHSAASGLAYNLNDPNDYSNPNKYPLFLVNGCTAGNIFDYDANRSTNLSNVSERWVLAKNKGSIGFIATTHFGLTGQLDYYSNGFYNSLAKNGYGLSVGKIMLDALAELKSRDGSFYGIMHGEQFMLHGDPAVKIYNFTKPDYVIEDEQVSVSPTFVSVLDNQFTFKANIYNIGKAVGDSVRVLVKRKYPNGTVEEIFNKKIVAVRFKDNVEIVLPIDALRDKGNNSITITVDSDNLYDELSETNNTITKNFVIYEDELKPVYPQNFAIINKAQIKVAASTANPLASARQYVMEMDTTSLFNSQFKITKTITSFGGVLEFDPSITFVDSTVYFWRVAPVPNSAVYRWNNSSFIYLQSAPKVGYNQSHFYQHTQSNSNNLQADTIARKFDFKVVNQNFTIRNGVWPYNGETDANYSISINNDINSKISGICWRGNNIVFSVFNPNTLAATYNCAIGSTAGQYGTLYYPSSCNSGREYDFAFNTNDSSSRKKAMDFMENIIPNGSYVIVRSIILDDPYWATPTYANDWKQDATLYGTSLYHKLKNAGFADIDSFNRMRAFAFVYQKNNNAFAPVWQFTNTKNDMLTLNVDVKTKLNNGTIVSPKFGPVKKWYNMLWTGKRTDLEDVVSVKLLGVKADNTVDTLQTFTDLQLSNDISSINTTTYPYLKLYMQVADTINYNAFQLKYWRLTADPLPEGALAPNIKFTFKDTLDKGEVQNIVIAFKNVSEVDYSDSLTVKMQITDNNNTTKTIAIPKLKKLQVGDTATISTTIASEYFVGKNSFYVDVNPDNNPLEQNLTNNFAFRNFYVKADDKNPILDVTFNGVHILNGDIVSSKPSIRMALKDESKFMELNDTSLLSVQLKMPNGDYKTFKYGTDTLQFIPANISNGNNEALVEFNPTLLEDGTYELYVKSKDRSNNLAGPQQYRVQFTVNNKPMISNVFNYPNPFTTSTAFVFTLTGTTVPNNIKIQILTVTGKIVKEITKNELGNLHIGNNITDYKWDGTDTYGQPLGNGVYLYKVITSLNGNSLDKYNATDNSGNLIDTDKYFKAGYGKMYLMR
jgi:Peptidase family C25/CARDB